MKNIFSLAFVVGLAINQYGHAGLYIDYTHVPQQEHDNAGRKGFMLFGSDYNGYLGLCQADKKPSEINGGKYRCAARIVNPHYTGKKFADLQRKKQIIWYSTNIDDLHKVINRGLMNGNDPDNKEVATWYFCRVIAENGRVIPGALNPQKGCRAYDYTTNSIYHKNFHAAIDLSKQDRGGQKPELKLDESKIIKFDSNLKDKVKDLRNNE